MGEVEWERQEQIMYDDYIAFLVCQKILTELKSPLSKPFDSANICI